MKKYSRHIAKVYPDRDETSTISILLLGSMNYRMKSYGPKNLLKLHCGRTLIEYQLQTIKTVFPLSEIILSIGQDADKVIRNKPFNLKVVENQLWEVTNEVEYARLAMNACINNKILLINSDVYFDNVILNQIKNASISTIYYDDSGRLPDNEIAITVAENYATYFSFKHETKWCNMLYLENEDVNLFRNIVSDKQRKKQYLFEAINAMIEKKPIKAERSQSKVIYRIETSRDLEKIKNEVKNIDS